MIEPTKIMDLSSEELLRRKDMLKQLESFIGDATTSLNNFVEKLGWTLDKTPSKKEVLVKCPINSEHRMLPSKLDEHYQKCILKQNGYDSSKHSLYPSYNIPSSSSAQSIQIDKNTQMDILKTAFEESNFTLSIKPELREVSQSIERYNCEFTTDERRVLYDSAVKTTKLPHHDITNELTGVDLFNKTNEKPKTELEILEEQRDLKRRRAAYRGKRVHTDRKSYVEVLREVVEGLTNSLSQQEDKSVGIETTNSTTETFSSNRIIYKYEGNKNFSGNPYTRWLDIDTEESKIFKYYENKSDNSYQESNYSGIHYSRNKYNIKKSRKSRSKSRKRSSSSELKSMRSKMSDSQLKFKEIKSKKPKSRSKSKETTFQKSRSRSVSIEYKHKRLKVSKTKSKSNENIISNSLSQSISKESKHKKSKRRKSRSTSEELSFRKKIKHSRSPINCDKSTLSNEKDTMVKLKLNDSHKKKKKHKKKRKHSKSSKRSHKSKNHSDIEVHKHADDKISTDDDNSSHKS